MTLSRHSKYVLLSWLIIAVVAVIMLVPGVAGAQGTVDPYKLRIGLFTTPLNGNNFGSLIMRLLNIVLLLGGIIAFFYVIYGGFMYLTAGADPGNADKGRKTIFNAMIGIIIISISYALVTFVASQTPQLPIDNSRTTSTPTPRSTP